MAWQGSPSARQIGELMADSGVPELIVENRHSGERLVMRRVKRDAEVWLELKGSLPPHREGPPLHIHVAEDEEGVVRSGTLSAVLNGRRFTAGSGERVWLPRGSTHRWWNAGNEPLVFEGYVRPAVDLDRFLQAIFEVLNAGSAGRPPLFYMAHLLLRHRRTQTLVIMPRPIQAVLFRMIVTVGTLLGRYRGDGWPGCPFRCVGAPFVEELSLR
jgi:mannose-6-phosphate isomerase-like protein (cupin superfamily)